MPDTVATAQRPQTSGSAVRELTFAEAIREALAEEMRRDPTVVLLGEDVAEAGTPFKVVKGLVDEFGKDRVVDTPISEAGFTGLAVGAAMAGMRPVVDIMFGDFMTLIMDQVVNQAAKIHYMSGGKWKVPMVIRATMGATRRSAAEHSQSLHAWPSHVPGLKVAIPSMPYDAKGLIKSAIRDNDPVLYFEHKYLYRRIKEELPSEDFTVPIRKAIIRRKGRDISVITYGAMVYIALDAAKELAKEGIELEVLDLRSLLPYDREAVLESAKKTSKVILLHEDTKIGGFAGELAALISEEAFDYLDGPIRRITAPDTPVPYSPPLEEFFLPKVSDVVRVARELHAY